MIIVQGIDPSNLWSFRICIIVIAIAIVIVSDAIVFPKEQSNAGRPACQPLWSLEAFEPVVLDQKIVDGMFRVEHGHG